MRASSSRRLTAGTVAVLALSGAAHAGVSVAGVIDPFQTLNFTTGPSPTLTGGWGPYAGGSAALRNLPGSGSASGVSAVSMSGGTMTLDSVTTWVSSARRVFGYANYNNVSMPASPSDTMDLSAAGAYFSVDAANVGSGDTGAVWKIHFAYRESPTNTTYRYVGGSLGNTPKNATNWTYLANGNNRLYLSAAAGTGTFDWANVARIEVQWGGQTSATAVTTTLTNFQFVPAPGAVTLLAAAGLAGSRRRRRT